MDIPQVSLPSDLGTGSSSRPDLPRARIIKVWEPSGWRPDRPRTVSPPLRPDCPLVFFGSPTIVKFLGDEPVARLDTLPADANKEIYEEVKTFLSGCLSISCSYIRTPNRALAFVGCIFWEEENVWTIQYFWRNALPFTL